MTEEERKVPPAELTDAVDRAVMAGLYVRGPDEVRSLFQAWCLVCGASLMVPAVPWRPRATSRRLEDFALAHRDHVCRKGGAP